MLLVTVPVLAQDMCISDFDYDGDCDGSDAARFKLDFGRSIFENPCPQDGPAPVEKTGQTICYEGIPPYDQIDCAGTSQDGEYQKGVTWPYPRFTNNIDGTVTDNLTGLIWLNDANCFGTRNWSQALSDCNGLANGSCGLTDGSSAGDWRLPNKRELFSITHAECFPPAVPNTTGTGCWSAGDPFNNVQASRYWSSTTYVYYAYAACCVNMSSGVLVNYSKTSDFYVWPVRGGH